MESLVLTGIRREWFEEFLAFWTTVLGGRPLNIMDFHMLRFHYRVIMQETEGLIWSDSKQHELNWQRDKNMSFLFQQIYSDALNPIKDIQFISKGDRVLE